MTDEVTSASQPAAPVARKQATERCHHGDVFIDEYEWLRDKTNPEVIAHLEAENAYTAAITAPQQPLREAIFTEIKTRTHETSVSLPSRSGNWWYFQRMTEGGQQPVYCRVPADLPENLPEGWIPPQLTVTATAEHEQVLLDADTIAKQHDFYALGSVDVARDGSILIWTEDTVGDERFTLRARNLETGELLTDTITGLGYNAALLPDGRTVLYTLVDESWRPHELRLHRLGTDPATDTLVLREDDPELWLSARISDNNRFLVLEIGNSEVDEVRLLPLVDDTPLAKDACTTVIPRDARVRYLAEPVRVAERDCLAVLHHEQQPNGELVLVELTRVAAGKAQRIAELEPRILLAGSETDRLGELNNTGSHLTVDVLREGLSRVLVFPLANLDAPVLQPSIGEPLVSVRAVPLEFGAPVLRLEVKSWLETTRQFEVSFRDLAAGAAPTLRHRVLVRDYDPSRYEASRHWAVAKDGARIPITVLRRNEVPLDGSAPAIIYGYGSYEISLEPALSLPTVSVLDRGVVYVYAHVRGGGELGRSWYEQGKKRNKPTTFSDFLAVTNYLGEAHLIDAARVAAIGGSAGGLLMGAIANLAPERYRAIVAQVPFVDPLTSILDPDLPLSALEWEEWGNPITDARVYSVMKAYSPYENIRAVDYPAIAAVTSLNDTRVLYVEPAKWVAKLREVTRGTAPIVLKTQMHGGHGGGSGRYQRWRDWAWDYAFALTALDATQPLTQARGTER